MSRAAAVALLHAAARVRDAQSLRSFKHAVNEFVRVLSEVPDDHGGAASGSDVRTMQALGQDVIEYIEERVADIPSAAEAQTLVSDVYEIRRLLEEVSRARQHYAIMRHV